MGLIRSCDLTSSNSLNIRQIHDEKDPFPSQPLYTLVTVILTYFNTIFFKFPTRLVYKTQNLKILTQSIPKLHNSGKPERI